MILKKETKSNCQTSLNNSSYAMQIFLHHQNMVWRSALPCRTENDNQKAGFEVSILQILLFSVYLSPLFCIRYLFQQSRFPYLKYLHCQVPYLAEHFATAASKISRPASSCASVITRGARKRITLL